MTPDPATLPARLSTMLRSLDRLRPDQIATLEEAVEALSPRPLPEGMPSVGEVLGTLAEWLEQDADHDQLAQSVDMGERLVQAPLVALRASETMKLLREYSPAHLRSLAHSLTAPQPADGLRALLEEARTEDGTPPVWAFVCRACHIPTPGGPLTVHSRLGAIRRDPEKLERVIYYTVRCLDLYQRGIGALGCPTLTTRPQLAGEPVPAEEE